MKIPESLRKYLKISDEELEKKIWDLVELAEKDLKGEKL